MPPGSFPQRGRTVPVPAALCEVAQMDGCSEPGLYSRIVLSVSKPGLTTAAMYTWFRIWNDVMGPLICIKAPVRQALVLAQCKGNYGSRLCKAASWVVTIPVLIVSLAPSAILCKASLPGV